MKNTIHLIVLICFCGSLYGQSTEEPLSEPATAAKPTVQVTPPKHCKETPNYLTDDSTAISMMGWGLLIAIGIATFCSLTEKNATKTSD